MTASSSDATTAPLFLQCTSGSLRGQTIPVTERGLVLGRAGDCDLRVDANTDVKVSGHHAKIESKSGSFYFVDTGSTNGSLVNGRPVHPNQPVRLDQGATIVLGEDAAEGTVGFTVSLAGQPTASAGQVNVCCPNCAEEFAVARAMMGRSIKCASCGNPVEVPIAAKLFSAGGSSAGDTHAPTIPPRQDAATTAADAGQGAGLFGKMRKAVSNFREKREIQDQLQLIQQHLRDSQTRAQADAVRLGRSAWSAAAEALAKLPGGTALATSQDQITALESQIAETQRLYDQSVKAKEASSSRWAETTAASADVLEKKQSAFTDAAGQVAEDDRAVREMVQASLAEARSTAPMIEALLQADATADLEADLLTLAETLGHAADQIRAGQGELAEPLAALKKAQAKREKAAEALQAARELHQANEQAASADRAQHEQACREAKARHEQIQRESEAIKASLEPAFAELGRVLVQQNGAGVIDEQDADLATALASHHKCQELQQQNDQLNARLAAL